MRGKDCCRWALVGIAVVGWVCGGIGIAAAAQGGASTYMDQLSAEQLDEIEMVFINSPPTPPPGAVRPVAQPTKASNILPVPTSTWTYGCMATAAGMVFAYYDRNGYPDMYTGPCNGGICPMTNVGQGIYDPIPGSCSIIATQDGFDGRSIKGHVDDYWISYTSPGPDPWESNWTEHTWGGCTADYMGTNQWKWDFDLDESRDHNTDGGTVYFYWGDGSKFYDPIPDASYGLPQTEACHGMRLFAESRGYTVLTNYNQLIDAQVSGGFTFAEYKAEIDADRPVLIHIAGHAMAGIGYDDTGSKVYLNDTWDNEMHEMTWGGSYAGSVHQAVTVIHLEPPSHFTITAQPVSLTVPEGLPAAFAVGITGGEGPMLYQWRKGGMDLTGADQSAYTIAAVQAGDAGSYTCLVTDDYYPESIESDPAALTVLEGMPAAGGLGLAAMAWALSLAGALALKRRTQ